MRSVFSCPDKAHKLNLSSLQEAVGPLNLTDLSCFTAAARAHVQSHPIHWQKTRRNHVSHVFMMSATSMALQSLSAWGVGTSKHNLQTQSGSQSISDWLCVFFLNLSDPSIDLHCMEIIRTRAAKTIKNCSQMVPRTPHTGQRRALRAALLSISFD